MRKRVMSFMLSVLLAVGIWNPVPALADDTAPESALQERADLRNRVIELTPEQGKAISEKLENKGELYTDDGVARAAKRMSKTLGASVYESSSDIYSSYYVYNKLDSEEKACWDQLDVLCRSYYDGTANAVYDSELEGYIIGELAAMKAVAGAAQAALERAEDIFWMYRYTHPQYFFLNNGVGVWLEDSKAMIAPMIYDSFATGTARAAERKKFEQGIQEFSAAVPKEGTDAEKIRAIHDVVCTKVLYDSSGSDEEDTGYTQSAYSAVILKRSVCAGYSLTFELLCNACDIPAILVTSARHAWNEVYVNGRWYTLDCTWDDSREPALEYSYYLRSDAKLKSLDINSNHVSESYWNDCLPVCSVDSGSTEKQPGSPAAAEGTLQMPSLTEEASGGTWSVSLSAGTDETIYYTLDGRTPSSANAKSTKYQNKITGLAGGQTIRAVAERDGYISSEPLSYTFTTVPHTHSYTHVPAKAATTSAAGNIEYWYCEGCGKYFSDIGDEPVEIAKSDVVIPKLVIALQSISLNVTKKTICTGTSVTLTPSPVPSDAAAGAWTWTVKSSKTNGCTYKRQGNKLIITAKKAGTIKATVKNGTKSAVCTLTVKAPSVTLKKTTLYIRKGKTATIAVKSIYPSGDSVKSYVSSNKKIATVTSKGKVRGLKTGKATITVTTKKGAKAKCTVTVRVL